MLIKTIILNDAGDTIFQANTEINGEGLIEVAKSRMPMAKEMGMKWCAEAIPFQAKDLVELTKKGIVGEEVERAAIRVAMAAWLLDNVYCNVSRTVFLKSDLRFTVLPGGAVKYDRLPAAR